MSINHVDDFDMPTLSSRSGYSIRTLRSYLQLGVLQSGRRKGRALLFTEDHIQRLSQIDELRTRGYSLAAIRDVESDTDMSLIFKGLDQRRKDHRKADRRTNVEQRSMDPQVHQFLLSLDELPELLKPVSDFLKTRVDDHFRRGTDSQDTSADRALAIRSAVSQIVEQLLSEQTSPQQETSSG